MLDDQQNPGGITCTTHHVLFDDGPLSVGSVESNGGIRGWEALVREEMRIKCASSTNGSIVWNKSWLSVGNPLCALDGENFLTLRPIHAIRRQNAVTFKYWNLEIRNSTTGLSLQSWRIPHTYLRGRNSYTEYLEEFIGEHSVNRNAVHQKAEFAIDCVEVRDVSTLDLDTKPRGLRAKIHIQGKRAWIDILSPRKATVHLR